MHWIIVGILVFIGLAIAPVVIAGVGVAFALSCVTLPGMFGAFMGGWLGGVVGGFNPGACAAGAIIGAGSMYAFIYFQIESQDAAPKTPEEEAAYRERRRP